ncbi:MAG: hypothetical protein ACJ8DZ_04555 [Allosphingosinicella sp.]
MTGARLTGARLTGASGGT